LRAVLDPNVLISAALSHRGAPGRVFRLWLEGAFDLVVSPMLLDDLGRALDYPKLKSRITAAEAIELREVLMRGGNTVDDSDEAPTIASPDPDDNYLIALASTSRSLLVSGDKDLLGLSEQLPVYTPAEFLALLDDQDPRPT
jgi:putative PIN family toxin of toxin-antitoxin system